MKVNLGNRSRRQWMEGLLLACCAGRLQARLPRAREIRPVKMAAAPEYCEGVVVDHHGFLCIPHGSPGGLFRLDLKRDRGLRILPPRA